MARSRAPHPYYQPRQPSPYPSDDDYYTSERPARPQISTRQESQPGTFWYSTSRKPAHKKLAKKVEDIVLQRTNCRGTSPFTLPFNTGHDPHYTMPVNYPYNCYPSHPPATGCSGYDCTSSLRPYDYSVTTGYPYSGYIPTPMTAPPYPSPYYSTYYLNGPSRRRKSRVVESGPGQSPRSAKPAAKLPPRPSVRPQYTPTQPQPEVTPSGLVLPLREDSHWQLNWPPKKALHHQDCWMLHPCLLTMDHITIPWKWDMSNYPKPSSVLQRIPGGLVLPTRKEELDAPVIYPNTKNKKIKIFVFDLPIAPLQIKASNDGQLTVRYVFTVLWEYLHTHMPNSWRDAFTKRHFQNIIPILKANRKARILRSGKLASIAEHGRPPKWIDILGENTVFAGLFPFHSDPEEEVREFSLRYITCSDEE